MAWFIFLNISSASTLFGFLSGWYLSASFLYFFFMSASVEVLGMSNNSYKLFPDLLRRETSSFLPFLRLCSPLVKKIKLSNWFYYIWKWDQSLNAFKARVATKILWRFYGGIVIESIENRDQAVSCKQFSVIIIRPFLAHFQKVQFVHFGKQKLFKKGGKWLINHVHHVYHNANVYT